MSIPSSVAVDLVGGLEHLATDRKQMRGPDFTRIPQQFEVGCALAERMVLVQATLGQGEKISEIASARVGVEL